MSPKIKYKYSINIYLTDILFFASYGLYMLTSLLWQSFYAEYFAGFYKYLRYLMLLLLLFYEIIKVCTRKTRLFDFLLFFVIVVLAGISVAASYNQIISDLTYLLLYVFAGRRIHFDKIARLSIVISVFVLAFVSISANLGIIQNYMTHRVAGATRNFLGFRFVLFGPAIFRNAFMLEIYLKKERIRYLELLIWGGALSLLYYFTDARLSTLISLLVLVFAVLMKLKPSGHKRHRIISFLLCFSFLICGLASIGITVMYSRSIPWMENLNRMLGGRIRLAHTSMMLYGVSLFAQKVKWVGAGLSIDGTTAEGVYNYVDCLYVKVLINYGIVFTLLLLGILTATMFKVRKNGDKYLSFMLIVIALHFMIDDLPFRLCYNTFWFAISFIWIRYMQTKLMQRR